MVMMCMCAWIDFQMTIDYTNVDVVKIDCLMRILLNWQGRLRLVQRMNRCYARFMPWFIVVEHRCGCRDIVELGAHPLSMVDIIILSHPHAIGAVESKAKFQQHWFLRRLLSVPFQKISMRRHPHNFHVRLTSVWRAPARPREMQAPLL